MAQHGRVAVALVGALLLTAGCAQPASDELQVYATTGYLADAVAVIAPAAEVTTMVGPGGDPHTYQPSTRDIETLRSADVVLWNGLHLEAQMTDQLTGLGDRALAVAEQLPEELLIDLAGTDAEGEPLHDPHVWNSPRAWTLVVGLVADHLAGADPAHAASYRDNAAAYVEAIELAAAEAGALLAGVPEPRILVTGHDAFAYLGASYDLQVHATDLISTSAVLGADELSTLADLIARNRVPAIFRDNQANPQAITSLQEAVAARGWDVEISDDELYADSLGAEPGVDTYLGVLTHNARTIAQILADR